MSDDRRTGSLYWLSRLLDDDTLDPTETLLMLALADHVDGNDECFVGIKRLAARARVSYGTARRRLAALEAAGRIERTARYRSDGGQSVYTYRLIRTAPPAQSEHPSAQPARGPRAPRRADPPAHQGARAEPPRKEQPQELTTSREQPLFDADEHAAETTDLAAERVAAGFDAFWAVYPRRTAKGAARSAWPAAVKAAGGIDVIVEGARRYRDDPNREDAFTAHPATWLRGERWDDPPLPPRGGRPANASRVDQDRSAPSGRISL